MEGGSREVREAIQNYNSRALGLPSGLKVVSVSASVCLLRYTCLVDLFKSSWTFLSNKNMKPKL